MTKIIAYFSIQYRIIGIVSLIMWLFSPFESAAMPKSGHLEGVDDLGGILDLLGTPADQGGIGSMSPEKAKAVTEWMDNPATRLGKTRNHKAGGGKLSAWNHRAHRHNPVAVARALSGDGTVNREVLNAARIHKLGDIASGRAPTDGHDITPKMKQEAKTILRDVRRFKRLPDDARLPYWLDSAGSGALNSPATVSRQPGTSTTVKESFASTRACTTRTTTRGGSRSATRFRVGVKVLGAGVIVGVAAYEAYGTEQAYNRGELNAAGRNIRHSGTAGGSVGAVGGAKAGGAVGAAIGTFICPGIGTAIGGFIGGAAGGITGYMGGRRGAEWVANSLLEE